MGYLCQLEPLDRWFFAKDMNCDGVFSVSDVVLWLKWIFYLTRRFSNMDADAIAAA
jgi:hypothetical protein